MKREKNSFFFLFPSPKFSPILGGSGLDGIRKNLSQLLNLSVGDDERWQKAHHGAVSSTAVSVA